MILACLVLLAAVVAALVIASTVRYRRAVRRPGYLYDHCDRRLP